MEIALLAPKTTITTSKNANSLKAAIFHSTAFKHSLEINKDQLTPSTKRLLLQSPSQCLKNQEKKQINFEQYSRLHMDGP